MSKLYPLIKYVGTVIAAALLACLQVQAQPVTYGAHLATYHADRNAGFNEFNPGLYVRKGVLTGGAYYHSERGLAVYGGVSGEREVLGVKVGALLGVVVGYANPSPMFVPYVVLPHGFRVAYLPDNPASKGNQSGIHFMKDF
jgi:hypothetical protein